MIASGGLDSRPPAKDELAGTCTCPPVYKVKAPHLLQQAMHLAAHASACVTCRAFWAESWCIRQVVRVLAAAGRGRLGSGHRCENTWTELERDPVDLFLHILEHVLQLVPHRDARRLHVLVRQVMPVAQLELPIELLKFCPACA